MKTKYDLSEEKVLFLKEIAIGHTCQEIADLFYNKFKIEYRASQIKDIKHKYKIKSGIIARPNSGNFKKGNVPHNYKGIGYEWTSKNGYTYIIIGKNKYVQKQRYIWEKYNGKIPKGHSVIFLNQNRNDFSLDNLALVKNKDKLTCKNKKMFSNNREITKLGLLNAQIINKAFERKKENG